VPHKEVMVGWAPGRRVDHFLSDEQRGVIPKEGARIVMRDVVPTSLSRMDLFLLHTQWRSDASEVNEAIKAFEGAKSRPVLAN
jgi:hypothetical protein